ncbi:MAG: aspartyl/asparaginyl beta-hydroxylase domain-containing protein [Planctomycetaceae bacterium]
MAQQSFDDLMRVSYDDMGIDGSPFVFPAAVRRMAAWVVSWHWFLFAVTVWCLHRTWGFFGSLNRNPLAQSWCAMASEYRLQDAMQLARAVRRLDRHPTFRKGCQTLGFRNCLDAMLNRGSFMDAFFRQEPCPATEFTHPHQRPSYFIPGIPAQQYYEAAEFPELAAVQQAFPDMKQEVEELIRSHRDAFGTFRTEFDNSVVGWNTFAFYINGRRQQQNCVTAPKTAAVAERLLELEEGELTMFSALNSGSYIPPHVGPLNGILRAHLPLIVSDGCGLRVGENDAAWTEGEFLIFDDSFVHTVWNHSDQVRIVLFFNLWHPCLSAEERHALANLRRAYNNTPFGRNWLKQQETSRPSTMHANAVR